MNKQTSTAPAGESNETDAGCCRSLDPLLTCPFYHPTTSLPAATPAQLTIVSCLPATRPPSMGSSGGRVLRETFSEHVLDPQTGQEFFPSPLLCTLH